MYCYFFPVVVLLLSLSILLSRLSLFFFIITTTGILVYYYYLQLLLLLGNIANSYLFHSPRQPSLSTVEPSCSDGVVCTHIYTRRARANVNVAQSFASLVPRSPPSRRSSGSNGFFLRYSINLRIIIVHYPNAFLSHHPVRIDQNDDDQVSVVTIFVYLPI